MTGIIKEISKILTAGGVEHECDPILKAPGTSSAYYRIHRKNKNILGHVLTNNSICATIRKSKPPARIKEIYGIDGKEVTYEGYAQHYLLAFPIINGLINGNFSVAEKKNFFIDIARER